MALTSQSAATSRLKQWLLWSTAAIVLVGSLYGVMRLTGRERGERGREASISEILLTGDPRQTSLEGLSAQLDKAREEYRSLQDGIARLEGRMSRTIEGVRQTFQRELDADRTRSAAERQREQQRLDREFGRLQSEITPGDSAAAAPSIPPSPRSDAASAAPGASSVADPTSRATIAAPPEATTPGEPAASASSGPALPDTSTPDGRGGTAPPERRMSAGPPTPRRIPDSIEPASLPDSDLAGTDLPEALLPDFPEPLDQRKPEDRIYAQRQPGSAAAGTEAPGPRRAPAAGAPAAARPLIRIIGSDVPGNTPVKPLAEDVYRLPATSILTGTLITGLDASTAQQSKRDPFPVLVRLQKTAILPNRYQADVRECFVLMAGYGDLSSERAYLRGETVSCVLTSGKVIETRLEGYAAGEDGKAGLRGTLVTKQGQFIARALMVGFLQGAAEVFSKGDSVTFGVSQSNNDETNPWGSAAMKGTGNALDRIAEFYIDQAYNLFPVIEVSAGREIDIVLTGRLDMPLPNG